MNLITREELRAKLERGDEFALVMTLSDFAYRAKHIPTSLHFDTAEEMLRSLDRGQEIVVYCADAHCPASIYAYGVLEHAGYGRVRRYAGGIADWEAARYPVEHGMPAPRIESTGDRGAAQRTMRPRRRTPSGWWRPCSQFS